MKWNVREALLVILGTAAQTIGGWEMIISGCCNSCYFVIKVMEKIWVFLI